MLTARGIRRARTSQFCTLVREREMGVQTAEVMRARFKHMDIDGNGTIELSEFLVFALRDCLTRSGARLVDVFKKWSTCTHAPHRTRLPTITASLLTCGRSHIRALRHQRRRHGEPRGLPLGDP